MNEENDEKKKFEGDVDYVYNLFKMLTRERKIQFVSNGLVSNFTLTNLQYQVSRSGQLGINPFHPKIGVYILHFVLFTFLLIQTMRICLTIRSLLNL